MRRIYAKPNNERTGFHIPSEYNKALLLEWFKKYKGFYIEPDIAESVKGRRYLEGAVIPEYCLFQYNIDPRDPNKSEQRRFLFKRDFNYEVVNDRDGNPVRAPISSKGIANEILNTWTEWATENGCKVPNPKLYKLWKNKYKIDARFPTFHDFLAFLKIDCDAMPSSETLSVLDEDTKEMDYPEYDPEKHNPQF